MSGLMGGGQVASGGNAPADADYWVSQANASLTNEVDMGALTTGILYKTVSGGVSTPSISVQITQSVNGVAIGATPPVTGTNVLEILAGTAWTPIADAVGMYVADL